MADIEAMFHQVRVTPDDSDVLRFLSWPDGDMNRPLEEFQKTVHLFGAVSSPSCANFALRKTATDNESNYDEKVISTILKNFYVDNCLKSVQTVDEAVQLIDDLGDACSKGGFRLTKWISNNRTVLESVPECERAKEVKDLDLDHNDLPLGRALAVQWCVETDTFRFGITMNERQPTRRGILSAVSSIYDPLGLISPFVLPAKVILQDLCRLRIGWDDEIPALQLTRWPRWTAELPKLANFAVSRCVQPDGFGCVESAQLHHFADASNYGYGTATYLRLLNKDGHVHYTLMAGKSRVAPIKPITIPRAELTAATVSVRMNKMLITEMGIPIDDVVFWTDSMTVLKYIENETTRFHTFVANRIGLIRDGSEPSQWRYVDSANNPADDASRGLSADAFLNSKRWIDGPDFLWTSETEWPKRADTPKCITQEDDPEVKKEFTVNTVIVEQRQDATRRLIAYFSDWLVLKKSVAWFIRLRTILVRLARDRKEIKRDSIAAENDPVKQQDLEKRRMAELRAHDNTNIVALTVQELQQAEHSILKYVQRESFREEIHALEKRCRVKKTSSLFRVDPVLDDGLLRVGGRLSRAVMPEEAKHPAILPNNGHVSLLIINHAHREIGHSGRNCVMSLLRQRYWIIRANAAVRSVINKCVICRRQRGKEGEQNMSDLPHDRLIPDEAPFTRTGVDYFGPIEVKRGRCMVKRYVALFTDLKVRAIHMEVVDSLTTDSCINALRRFIARRGQVKEIRSDNGTNFVGAERELREALNQWNQSAIHNAMLQKNVDWIFNPPAGSHHGGVWERQIRTVRSIARNLLKEQSLNEDCLQTFLCEIEAIVNNRPITKSSDDANDLEALTPNHLLRLKTKPNLPPGVFRKEDAYARRRWRQVQYMTDLFWKRWLREYVPLLQERQKWLTPRRNVEVGDVALIVDDKAPRNSWPLGRVLEVIPDSKGFVRRLKIKTVTSTLDRPIDKLVLVLEADN